jgi:hypothetical protein
VSVHHRCKGFYYLLATHLVPLPELLPSYCLQVPAGFKSQHFDNPTMRFDYSLSESRYTVTSIQCQRALSVYRIESGRKASSTAAATLYQQDHMRTVLVSTILLIHRRAHRVFDGGGPSDALKYRSDGPHEPGSRALAKRDF